MWQPHPDPIEQGFGMRFTETRLQGAWLIEPEPVQDHRGFFSRTFCTEEFGGRGLTTSFVQHSSSYNIASGTLRGMHFQRPPHGEVKLVSCLRGAVWDVIIDLRPNSPSFRQWQGFELTADNRRQLYVPAGCAHGFQTLRASSEVGYLISTAHAPAAAAGIRYDDAAFAIEWPSAVAAISEKDQAWPPFSAG